VDLLNFSFLEFDALYSAATPYSFGTLLAIFLIFFNFLFKITAAPFHF
jgi:NADH:ubiquinone oxidoreductase subunit 2 (subunit N)